MQDFFYGVIEGFYGRQWSWSVRKDYASFLSRHGYDCYIYAPKGDAYLRSRWREPYPPVQFEQLQSLRAVYRIQGLRWGLGLSPLGLAEGYNKNDRQQLEQTILKLNQLQPDILCILFDDIRGDIAGLAETQAAIVEDILSLSEASQHIVCPTYYSFDPVLEQVFGEMPQDYLATLALKLPEDIGIFWTGNKVISSSYESGDLARVEALLGRKPILWDNYPVNDGRLTSEHLHLKPYSGRSWQLSNWTGGHIVNPMNQPLLSQLVLQSLQSLYTDGGDYKPERMFDVVLDRLADRDFAESLRVDAALFQDQGRLAISAQQRQQMVTKYRGFSNPFASEISEWLEGGYRFDPECLTN